MLNKNRHQLLMGQILKDLYTDATIASSIGFKGGTCAYFFYNLPRFSVDLDFDWLGTEDSDPALIAAKLKSILGKYGTIKDLRVKRFTIFALLSYGADDRNIKIEINLRQQMGQMREHYEIKKHLGIPVLAAKPEYLFTSKLIALTARSTTAMRDIYDLHFFAKNHWDINLPLLEQQTAKSFKNHLASCIALIEKIKPNQILQGLGELLDEKEKIWAKQHLQKDTLFLLKNYQSVFRDTER